MSETSVPQSVNATVASAPAATLWQPVLFRSMVTLLFGIITVFWGSPDVLGLCLNFAWYFLAVAGSHFWFVRRLDLPKEDTKRLVFLATAGMMAVSGVVIFISVSTSVAAWLGSVALVLVGAGEIFAAFHKRAQTPKARMALRGDWLISGILGVCAGILLPFFINAGPHALLGVAGGGALMSGALWVLSALTLRHDHKASKGK